MTTSDKQLDMPTATDQRTLAWEAPEFPHEEKGFGWLVAVWLAAFVAAGFAVWYYKLSFLGIVGGLFPIAAALALTTQGRLKPQLVRISIDNQGINRAGHTYQWNELKGFWIVFSPLSQTLYLETTRRLPPIITMQLGKTDPEAVRTALLEHLPELTDQAEALNDRLARMIKF